MVTVTLKLTSVFEGVLFSRVGGFSLTGPSRKLKKKTMQESIVSLLKMPGLQIANQIIVIYSGCFEIF